MGKVLSNHLLDITSDYNPRSLINSIKHYFEQSDDVMEVLIYKGKKEISIERNYFFKKDFMKKFLQEWAK